jgi:hypothetical protein
LRSAINAASPLHQHAGSGGTERNRKAWSHEAELVVQPPAAGLDFAGIGFFVQPALAARLILEVLVLSGGAY